jgi:hypothetical protein
VKTWLLWASVKLDGLMTAAERDRPIQDLFASYSRRKRDSAFDTIDRKRKLDQAP